MEDNYNSNIPQNNQMEVEIGKNVEDFYIIKIINRDGDNFVAKVRSKLNKEVYFMKRMNKNQYINLDKIKYIERKIFFLKLLKNDNIVKYITDFEDNNFIYLITEYVDNGDLELMINSIRANHFQLEEEKLIRIFLQCLKSLTFMHSCGIIFRSLKPDRILIDNESNIKITNFKYAAFYDKEKVKQKLGIDNDEIYKKFRNEFEILNIGDYKAPEIKKGKTYLQKIDVYSLGITFCKLAYKMNKLPENHKNYSIELYEFISKMIENNPGNRLSAREAYNLLKNIYIKKFSHNSGIISYLRCLYSFPNIQYFLNRISFLIKDENKEKYPVLKQFYNFFSIIAKIKQLNLKNDFGNKIEEELNVKIYDFMEYLRERGFKGLNIRKEITPKNFSFLLFNLLQSEIEINKLNKEFTIDEILEKSYINQNENIEEKQKLIEIIKFFGTINSVISENFSVITKREKKCENCNHSFEAYKLNQFMLFKVKEMQQILKDKIDINKLLNIICEPKPKNNKQTCGFCKKDTHISKRSNLFNLSKYLIILFDRGANCKDKDFVNFDKELVIEKKNIELMRGNIDKYVYILYCAIIRKEINDESGYNKRTEKYIYYTRDLNENYFTRNDSKETYNITELKSEGDVVALFYYIKDLDQTKEKQDTNIKKEQNKISINPSQNPNQNPNIIINNPGQINNNPGQINNNPGQINNNPGQINNNSGQINNYPGQINNNPGQINNNPGQINNNSGQINNNPAQINNNPAQINNNPAKINNQQKFTNPINMSNNNGFNNNKNLGNNVFINLNNNVNNNQNQNSFVSNNNNNAFNNNINIMNNLEINNNNLNMNQNYEFNNSQNHGNFSIYHNNQNVQAFPVNNNIQNNVNNSNFQMSGSNNKFGNNALQMNDINNQNNAPNNANVFNMNNNNNFNLYRPNNSYGQQI